MAFILKAKIFKLIYYFNYSNQIKSLSNIKIIRAEENKLLTFNELQNIRRNEALKSVLFAYSSRPLSLISFCDVHGSISNVFFFSQFEKQYALIEFNKQSTLENLISTCKHFPNERRVPFESRCLYFKSSIGRSNVSHVSPNKRAPFLVNGRIIIIERGQNNFTDSELLNCSSIIAQMKLIHMRQSLTELEIRLRYFLCSEVESVAKKLFVKSIVKPFGSLVTGLSHMCGDLDMNLQLEDENVDMKKQKKTGSYMANGLSYYITKLRPENERQFSQQILEVMGGILRYMTPQMIEVRQILKARVPIIEFKHSCIEIECDLCLENESAIKMSKHLFYLFRCDSRILPLLFTIRLWARYNSVTKSNPGSWLSNFMITLLVIFYLQSISKPILPQFKNLSMFFDSQQNEKEIYSKVLNNNNSQSSAELLIGFFQLYSGFDFTKFGISIYNASLVEKEAEIPLFIENPIDTKLNASKNVLGPDLELFKNKCKISFDYLHKNNELSKLPTNLFKDPLLNNTIFHNINESGIEQSLNNIQNKSLNDKKEKSTSWGLLDILSLTNNSMELNIEGSENSNDEAPTTLVKTDNLLEEKQSNVKDLFDSKPLLHANLHSNDCINNDIDHNSRTRMESFKILNKVLNKDS